MVQYDPLKIGYDDVVSKLVELEKNLSEIIIPSPNVIEIPVCYGGEYGEDLSNVSSHNNITDDEVVKIHTSKEYLIYMIGFTPGFPYLGGMDERIATPRLSKPRIKIVGGSVGIAGAQTGVYPVDSPGGWQIIGRTPLKLYDALREKPILLKTGDYIKFTSISKEEFISIEEKIEKGIYSSYMYPMEEVKKN
jgi:KipI family sensor histidine kinase inhibitor